MRIAVTGLILVFVTVIVTSIIFTEQSDAAIDPSSIVGLWLFNEGSGATAGDSSATGNDGEIVGEEVNWVDGKYGGALEFVDGYVDCGKNESMNLEGKDITIAVLLKTEMELDGGYHAIAQNGKGPGSSQLHFFADGGGSPAISWNPIPNVQLMYPIDLTDGLWHYIVVDFDDASNQSSLYIDGAFGVSVAEPKSIGTNPDNLILGSDWAHPKNRWIGDIDEVAIFSAALSEGDIMRIMAEGVGVAAGVAAAVSPSGKTATVWGAIKAR